MCSCCREQRPRPIEQEPALRVASRLLDEGMLVTAICGATLGLANAGLLDNALTPATILPP